MNGFNLGFKQTKFWSTLTYFIKISGYLQIKPNIIQIYLNWFDLQKHLSFFYEWKEFMVLYNLISKITKSYIAS